MAETLTEKEQKVEEKIAEAANGSNQEQSASFTRTEDATRPERVARFD